MHDSAPYLPKSDIPDIYMAQQRAGSAYIADSSADANSEFAQILGSIGISTK